jgi:hypothetical protein
MGKTILKLDNNGHIYELIENSDEVELIIDGVAEDSIDRDSLILSDFLSMLKEKLVNEVFYII